MNCFRRSYLKREIPQKVDAKFSLADQVYSASVARFCTTLFRRTRSASLLSFTLTAGTLGVLFSHQKAEAFPTGSPAPLGSVPSLPHLFNSADTSSESYPSFNYLDTQSGISVLQADANAAANNIVFQPNEALSANLQLQTLPKSFESSKTIQDTALVSATESANVDSADIATSAQTPDTQSNAGSEGLTVAAPEPLTFVHKVEIGENLTAIADRYQVSPEAIALTNRIANPNVIEVHEDLVIPTASLSAAVATPLMLGTLASDTKAILNEADRQGISAKLLEPEQSASQPTRLPLVPTMKEQDSEAPQLEAAQSESTQATATAPLVQPRLDSLAYHQTSQQPPSSTSLEVTSPLAATTTVARRVAFPQMPSLDLPALAAVDEFLPSTLQGGGSQKYIWPAHGAFTSGFGYRWGRMHKGIDIAAPVGTPVVAAASGVVESAGWNEGGYGNLVEVRHPDGSLTIYAHNSRIATRVGAVVNQGELIAQMGSTGRSTGPHTHFEIRPRGSGAVNPMFFLSRS
jgi:murein DD-endopeptidase MepM/ murein hydrolase activator NlpD